MLDLYEPGKAEKGKLSYGSDYVAIRYPEVSSCMTLTLVYPRVMVGAHFGEMTKGKDPTGRDSQPFSAESAKGVLKRMVDMAAPDHDVQRALLIGCNATWMNGRAKEAYDAILTFCKEKDPKFRAYLTDTTDYGSVTIEVHRDQNLITIQKTGGPVVNTRKFDLKK